MSNKEPVEPKVLVIDAYPLNLELILEVLKAAGFNAEGAGNGNEAIVKADKELYDLVLTGIKLSGIEGTEVVKLLKRKPQYKQVPVIAFTGYAMKEDRERFLSAGFDDYISKPISVHDLKKILEKYKTTFIKNYKANDNYCYQNKIKTEGSLEEL